MTILGFFYFQLRLPQPTKNDISYQIPTLQGQDNSVTVDGKIITEPRLTRKDRVQFWFKVEKLEQQPVTGKLYVTVPLLQGTGLYPRQQIQLTGSLYEPKSSVNPGAFDFRAYLARNGTFAGLTAYKVTVAQEGVEPIWGLWKIRRRIIRAQVRWLGSSRGALVGSMVLGRRAVDLSYDLRDLFIHAGLAHVLAASGFHVSLLLGLVLYLTGNLSGRSQLIIGIIILIIYIGLTGIQPSVMRASLMGVAVLIGLSTERKVRPLGALFLVAFILLVINPLWITDLGFQLSFLATFGLIVTAPALQKKLDWLPSTIATLIAVPLAASLWTLPLTAYVFNVIATYSIPVNIITTPLIMLISLGGMISAVGALIYPLVGSAIAFLLYYPTQLLITIVTWFTHLPGSSYAIGQINLIQMLVIYALMALVLLSKWWQRRWLLIGLFIITLMIIPMWYRYISLIEVNILAAKNEQVIIINNQGKVALFSSSNQENYDIKNYTITPFLANKGINKIDLYCYEIKSNFSCVKEGKSINWQKDKSIYLGTISLKLISKTPFLLQFSLADYDWLLLNNVHNNKLPSSSKIKNVDILLWTGRKLKQDWLEGIKPQTAIASSNNIDDETKKQLKKQRIKLYYTGRDGGIQWTPEEAFKPFVNGRQITMD